MNTWRLVILSAIFGLAVGACSKADRDDAATSGTQAPSDASTAGNSDPAAASSPSQREATSTDVPESATPADSDPAAASTPSQQEATEPAPN